MYFVRKRTLTRRAGRAARPYEWEKSDSSRSADVGPSAAAAAAPSANSVVVGQGGNSYGKSGDGAGGGRYRGEKTATGRRLRCNDGDEGSPPALISLPSSPAGLKNAVLRLAKKGLYRGPCSCEVAARRASVVVARLRARRRSCACAYPGFSRPTLFLPILS